MNTRTIVVSGLSTLLVIGVVAACSSYNDARGRGDAPVGPRDRTPAEVINMPDEFGNIATKCDNHGHRLYVVTHNKTDAPVTVVVDPSCGSTR